MSPIVVDARRLLCPLPVIRVQDRAQGLPPGTRIEVVATDPGALLDIPSWCRINGHRVIETRSENHEHFILLELGGDA